MATSAKKKAGRPPKVITDQMVRQIEVLAGYGLTEAAIAAVMGMSKRVFSDKKNTDDISAALTRGRAIAENTIGEALFVRAKAGDMQAIMWWEKTRANRSDRAIMEHRGEGGGPVEIEIIHRIIDVGQDKD